MDHQVEGGVAERVGDKRGADALAALLSGAPFLVGLSPEIIADVLDACEVLRIPGESQLGRRDVPSDSFYVVVHGGLRTIGHDQSGHERVTAEAFCGDGVDLPALVGVSGQADVYAIRDSELLRLTRARFEALAARHPELLLRLAKGLARRGLELVAHQPVWTAWARPGMNKKNLALLVPTSDHYFADAASDLVRVALENHGSVSCVSREIVDGALGAGVSEIAPSDPRSERLLTYLHAMERRSDVVLYECETASREWSGRCMRQADHVIALVRPDHPEHIEELRPILEPTLRRQQPPRLDLVLVHSSDAELPGGPKRWAWLDGPARVHHVRMGERKDYERVARTILGRAVGVVLSGGGARGIAHVGVLKAIEDAGVPIDYVAGTSMGSIFAAGCARGWSADTMMERVRTLFRSRTALYDPTIPFSSLLAGHKLERVLRSYFEGIDIEGLWLPFFCVSTDLTRAGPHVHEHGELWSAVAASCSIPGIFPPRRDGTHVLVDGGVVANLPLAAMAERLDGDIIASDVNLYGEVTPEPTASSTIARLLDFARWINPLGSGGTSPEIFEVLLRSSQIGSRHAEQAFLARGEVSLYLPLPVEHFRLLDWGAHDELYRIGRESANEHLAAWQPRAHGRIPSA